MAISDSHAMHRMPPASSAAASASPCTADSPSKGATISQENKWHSRHQFVAHSWQLNGDTSGSTLSRSMRYADPWLNSTGGGKYGTVRCSSSSYGAIAAGSPNQLLQRRAGTVRVTSSTCCSGVGGRGRPTVLPAAVNAAADPYDMVRRSRLGRSVSPDRSNRSRNYVCFSTNAYMSAYATFGRRSILECDVNPYDLMDEEASITCVNGQRIRVRPSLSNLNYDDVTTIKNTNKQLSKSIQRTDDTYSNVKSKIVNADNTSTVIGSTNTGTTTITFKSILKKKSAVNSDDALLTSSLSNCSSSSTTLIDTTNNLSTNTWTAATCRSRKSNRSDRKDHLDTNLICNNRKIINNNNSSSKRSTQFYIPMPPNSVSTGTRKKVQFLMSPEKGSVIAEEYFSSEQKETVQTEYYSNVHTTDDNLKTIDATSATIKSTPDRVESTMSAQESFPSHYRLQRSISERFNNQMVPSGTAAPKVVFRDSMALRSRGTNANKHQDTRTVFSISGINSAVPVRLCSDTDLERLDGVSRRKVDTNQRSKRPVAPPPQPPTVSGQGDGTLPVVPPRKRSNNKEPVLHNIIKISHRIQIRNELPPAPPLEGSSTTNDNVNTICVMGVEVPAPLSTSILIGPDDHCYSTVNVNGDDCYPHYRSSVVVGEKAMPSGAINYNSSKVYITSNCGRDTIKNCTATKRDAYEEVCCNTNDISTINDLKIQEGYEDIVNTTTTMPKYEDIVYADATALESTKSTNHFTELSSELLQSLLCDPVEAVRRNLVPHVCGKDLDTTSTICNKRRSVKASHGIKQTSANAIEDEQPLIDTDSVEKGVSKDQAGDGSPYVDGTYEPLNGSMTSSAPSDCYTDSNRSSVTEDELHARSSKFYELLADATLAEVSSDLDLELDLDLAYSSTNNTSVHATNQVQNIDNHHYESILLAGHVTNDQQQQTNDSIYEDIDICGGASGAVPPPLPAHPPPPQLLDDLHISVEYTTRSIFEGASKYDILSYLVDAKERGCVEAEDICEQEEDSYTTEGVGKTLRPTSTTIDHTSDVNGDVIQPLTNLSITPSARSTEIERNDSGVGSETSKCSLSKYRNGNVTGNCNIGGTKVAQNCEDCDNEQDDANEEANNFASVDGSASDSADTLQPLLCKRCAKRRVERREIIMEIVETEEKYMRDLQITLEEFYHPMLIAGLLTPDQLQAIFLNIEELLDNSTLLSDRLRDIVDMAVEQGDEDLLQVDIGRLFLDAGFQMLHAFEIYCVRQGGAALLLAGLEKEKELLRVFLRVSQMENVVLRRMNLSSFLMVPVQRVTKYPLLLARLYKVTPAHQEDTRSRLHEAQHTIELHLNHINSETHNIPTKLWRRLNSTTNGTSNNKLSPSGSSNTELVDLVGIKLRKIAVDALEWNHEEATFALEGRLLVTQPQVEGHHQWRKGRTIKLSPVCAMLVTCGGGGGNHSNKGYVRYGRKTSGGTSFGKIMGKLNGQGGQQEQRDGGEEQLLVFPARQRNCSGVGKSVVREAALLLLRDKGGRHSLLREPLYLDRCVVAADPAWQSYFEVQELHHTMHSTSAPSTNGPGGLSVHSHTSAGNASGSYGNSTYIFRAEDDEQTRIWYKQLQYYAQGMGAWRRRRNALPNIMIAGLGLR